MTELTAEVNNTNKPISNQGNKMQYLRLGHVSRLQLIKNILIT